MHSKLYCLKVTVISHRIQMPQDNKTIDQQQDLFRRSRIGSATRLRSRSMSVFTVIKIYQIFKVTVIENIDQGPFLLLEPKYLGGGAGQHLGAFPPGPNVETRWVYVGLWYGMVWYGMVWYIC